MNELNDPMEFSTEYIPPLAGAIRPRWQGQVPRFGSAGFVSVASQPVALALVHPARVHHKRNAGRTERDIRPARHESV